MTGLIASAADGWWYSLAVAAGLGTAACRLPRARARISVLCMAVVPLCLVPLVANTTAGGDTSQMTPCTYAVIAGSIAGTAASVLEAARAPVPAATPPTRAHVPLLLCLLAHVQARPSPAQEFRPPTAAGARASVPGPPSAARR
ncbi:hypothetical protein ACFVUW_15110 [Streptomyces xiamenensis]|uniref:hypothetical protein n=1 Tax=Streptomyces xiamenensis TaxID=408015 RepID=UPI0036EF4714